MRSFVFAAALAVSAGAVSGQEAIVESFDGTFDDAKFAVESAITNKGLVIDYVSHVGEMLNRTGQDVGSDVAIFDQADIFIFCSASVSRAVMEADPANIAHCPYGIFVTEKDSAVEIGYRSYPEGAMQAVQTLLAEIVSDATGN